MAERLRLPSIGRQLPTSNQASRETMCAVLLFLTTPEGSGPIDPMDLFVDSTGPTEIVNGLPTFPYASVILEVQALMRKSRGLVKS